MEAFAYCISLTNVTISSGVSSIGDVAFWSCTSLTNVTIPASVTNIGDAAFSECANLRGVFFQGNAPNLGSPSVFANSSATVYFLPGTTGWGATFAGRPALLWNPLMQTSSPGFGIGPGGFGFNITGTTNIPIVVEAATNLATAT